MLAPFPTASLTWFLSKYENLDSATPTATEKYSYCAEIASTPLITKGLRLATFLLNKVARGSACGLGVGKVLQKHQRSGDSYEAKYFCCNVFGRYPPTPGNLGFWPSH